MKKYIFSISIACIANMSMRSFTVLCEAKKEPGDWLADLARKGKDAMGSKSFDFQTLISSDSSEKVREFARDLLRPEKVGQISYGFAAGFASGYCIKKVAKAAAFAVGGLFIIVQTLAYNGYLTVNQDRIKEEFEENLDINQDGKIDEQDALSLFEKVKPILTYNMPTGGGFAAGFFLGVRK